jgi:hypothetical protein
MLRVVEKPTKENEELRTTLDELLQPGALKMCMRRSKRRSKSTSTAQRGPR